MSGSGSYGEAAVASFWAGFGIGGSLLGLAGILAGLWLARWLGRRYERQQAQGRVGNGR